ncbi:uncharacterized protein [Prorops nasuta]|uniref:uncharacterized protein n=1 Tax=Prorops nasuta TaxID=863751 RepID=UPI0034CD8355
MSFALKRYKWAQECALKIKANNDRQKVLIALLVNEIMKKKKYKSKRFWVHPVLCERRKHGFYHAIYPVLSLEESRFRNYFRMTKSQLEEILIIIAPYISKKTVVREPISAAERLCLTLRFLASGDSMTSISYQYLIGLTTVSHIIDETCDAIWMCFQEKVLPSTLEKNDWLNIAKNFEKKWDFNHCIGAIDGKHVLIQCPDNAGSSYFNYKKTHSIVLLAICDADYIFTYVDIGAFGRRSDSGIFRSSIVGNKFNNKEMNLPDPEPLTVDGPPLPYVLVGDEAFPLTDYLLRPYSAKGVLTSSKTVFNYRLSRSRKVIENSFGILVSRWRVLKRPIICKVEKAENIVKAIICLHNFLRKQDIEENQYVPETLIDREDYEFTPGSWRNEIEGSAIQEIRRLGANNSTHKAIEIREEFCYYFNNEGAIPFQYSYC